MVAGIAPPDTAGALLVIRDTSHAAVYPGSDPASAGGPGYYIQADQEPGTGD